MGCGLDCGYGVERWVKPQPHKVKVNVDASIFQEQARHGFGIVTPDNNGVVVR